MYRLLIVDDDIHVVEGIIYDLDTEKLGISELYTANNVRQAKEVFERHRVDILLCDIEMPQSSGLELLAWVRTHYPATEAIIVTSHADFQYAMEALKLGSSDYLLKPVLTADMEKAIEKAKGKLAQTNQSNHYYQLWARHHPLIIERFWLDLLHHSIPANPHAVKQMMEERQLPYKADMLFLPVIVIIQRWHKELDQRDEKVMEYALRKSAAETLVESAPNGVVISLETGRLLLVYALAEGEEADLAKLKKDCEAYIASCRQYFYCDLCCYMGLPILAHEFPDMYENLSALERNNVALDNQVFIWSDTELSSGPFKLPDMKLWSAMMKNGAKEQVLFEASEYLGLQAKTTGMDAHALRQFQHSFLQMTYLVLNLKGIEAHRLFSDAVSTELSLRATRTITDMLAWVNHTVSKANEKADAVAETNDVVDNARKYIALNLDQEDLSRDSIAAQAYMNADYLSRIFKKETGFSISDYVLQERIKAAKELLEKTDMPVGAVAISVGYSNFSHFTKIFKKYTDNNPLEYRKHLQERAIHRK